jgi:hypothetical protein
MLEVGITLCVLNVILIILKDYYADHNADCMP